MKNGTALSHGGSTGGKLERLLAHHQQIVAALQTALALLNGEAVAKKAETNGHGVLGAALTLDAARRQTLSKTKQSGYGSRVSQKARRQASARLLATFDQHKPKPGIRAIAPLVINGYLKKQGDGWVRTGKAFTV